MRWAVLALCGVVLVLQFSAPSAGFSQQSSLRNALWGLFLVVWVIIAATMLNGG